MSRSAMLLAMSLLVALTPGTGAAQALSALPITPARASFAADDSVPGDPHLPPGWRTSKTATIWQAADSARGVPLERIVLGVQLVAATALGTRLAVDDDGQWRRCSSAYPEPYPSYDRALSRRFYDGLCMPRWEHHAARVFIAQTTDQVARRLLGIRETPAALLTAVAVGAGPHVVSRLSRVRGPKPTAGDAAADVWLASMPLTVPKRLGGRWTGIALWVGGYALLYPYARP